MPFTRIVNSWAKIWRLGQKWEHLKKIRSWIREKVLKRKVVPDSGYDYRKRWLALCLCAFRVDLGCKNRVLEWSCPGIFWLPKSCGNFESLWGIPPQDPWKGGGGSSIFIGIHLGQPLFHLWSTFLNFYTYFMLSRIQLPNFFPLLSRLYFHHLWFSLLFLSLEFFQDLFCLLPDIFELCFSFLLEFSTLPSILPIQDFVLVLGQFFKLLILVFKIF